MIKGVDYSYARPTPKSVKNEGYTFVGRYVGPEYDTKSLTANEVVELVAAGLDIVCFFEQGQFRALGGRDAGIFDGYSIREHLARIGLPKGTVVHFTVDFQPTTEQLIMVGQYFAGICEFVDVAHVGVYGSAAVLDAVCGAGFATHGFQTVAWSEGHLSPHARFLQTGDQVTIDGIVVDIDEQLITDSTTTTSEDEPVLSQIKLEPGTNAHVALGCAGATKLRIHAGYGDSLTIHQIVPEGDTPAGDGGGQMPGGWDEADHGGEPWVWQADRDGPWDIPAGATQLVLRYDATVPVFVSVSDR